MKEELNGIHSNSKENNVKTMTELREMMNRSAETFLAENKNETNIAAARTGLAVGLQVNLCLSISYIN